MPDNILTDQINNIFNASDSIPQQHQVPEIHQREYLLNGELVKWDGPVTEIHSPIFTKGGEHRKLLGTIPQTSAVESKQALHAAVTAYNNGRGKWPLMKVDDRIRCMEKFVYLMIGQRELVINLL